MGTMMVVCTVLTSLLVVWVFHHKLSILPVLVLLEVLMYGVMVLYLTALLTHYGVVTYFLALLCLAACGAACGLSLLVTLGRYTGTDLIKGLMCAENSWTSEHTQPSQSG